MKLVIAFALLVPTLALSGLAKAATVCYSDGVCVTEEPSQSPTIPAPHAVQPPSVGTPSPPPGVGMPPGSMIPVRFCRTQAGTCNVPPTLVPMGTPCHCGGIPGEAF